MITACEQLLSQAHLFISTQLTNFHLFGGKKEKGDGPKRSGSKRGTLFISSTILL
jgi:hypothetical protein